MVSTKFAKTYTTAGGYGTFGSIICERLSTSLGPDSTIIIAGRSLNRATQFADQLKRKATSNLIAKAIDIDSSNFQNTLNELKGTKSEKFSKSYICSGYCGSYQRTLRSRDWVPRCSSRYRLWQLGMYFFHSHFFLIVDIDLADSREFVSKFPINDVKNCVLITGASSVPGVSSSAVNEFQKEFSQMETIQVAITPGNRTPRGIGTTRSVLQYCGKPFLATINKSLETIYGWMGTKRERFIGLRFVQIVYLIEKSRKQRLVSFCNVPDLDLFPKTFPELSTFLFRH